MQTTIQNMICQNTDCKEFRFIPLSGGMVPPGVSLLCNDRTYIYSTLHFALEHVGISPGRIAKALQELNGQPLSVLFENRQEIAAKFLHGMGKLEPHIAEAAIMLVGHTIKRYIWRFELIPESQVYLYGVRAGAYPNIDEKLRVIPVTDDDLAHCSVVDLKTNTVDFVCSEEGCRHVWFWHTNMPLLVQKLHARLKAQRKEWPLNLLPVTSV